MVILSWRVGSADGVGCHLNGYEVQKVVGKNDNVIAPRGSTPTFAIATIPEHTPFVQSFTFAEGTQGHTKLGEFSLPVDSIDALLSLEF
jgi:hypothetical protein